MRIANPLYDHAFKYLMSNDRLARKVLSVILEKEVLDLELSQQEIVMEDRTRQFTLYRLDFKARIRDAAGREETVLIELQKSKLPTNALRFRSYLGLAYTQKTKTQDENGLEQEKAYPLISIYIMGYNLEDIPVMAAKVDRKIIDMARQEELQINSDFIDLLTHTCYILQVRRLPPDRRSRIEQFMTLFNQAWVQEEKFILDLEEVPEEFADVAEYLQRSLFDEATRSQLRAEQELEYLFAIQEAEAEHLRQETFASKAREAEALAREAEAKTREAEAKTREAEAKIREAEAKIREEEARTREAEERRQKEVAQETAKESARKLARILLQLGKMSAEIVQETGLSQEEIEGLKD